MTIAIGAVSCAEPDRHEWVLRSIDYEDLGPVSVFECLLCGRIDHRSGGR